LRPRTGRPVTPDAVRAWYDANARRYDRHHLGIAGDAGFYAALAAGRHVLEVGAGTGRVTAALLEVAASVVAVDISAPMLGRARARLGDERSLTLVQADACSLPFRHRFGLVVLPYRVVHHIAPAERRRASWVELRRLLATDGLLAFDSWHGPHGSRDDPSEPPAAPIARATLRQELIRSGLQIECVLSGFPDEVSDGRSFNSIWLARSAPPASP
jgi:SAM-dependent methyltransferase